MSQKIERLILPFSVLSENRSDPFSEEMEMATIYCLTELEREKGGGILLKKSEENLLFLAEFCYPLWLVPWNNLSLIFDGLKTTTYNLTYRNISGTKTFMENAQRSSKSMETFMSFVSDNINYFRISGSERTTLIEALIEESNVLNEFNLYFSEAKPFEESSSTIVPLPPIIDESTILSMKQELENLKLNFKEDVDLLYSSIKLLNKATRNFVKAIRNEIKVITEEFAEEIKKQESAIMPKINRINEEYEEQITKLTKDFEKRLLPLQKEKVKLEKNKEQTLSKIERYNIEAKTCADNKDVLCERKWKEKANEVKKEFSVIENQLEEFEEKIKEIKENKSLETFRLRSEWEAKIKEAKKDLLELEASRDAKIQIHKQEIEKLESLTSAIIEQINKTAKLREANIANVEKLGIQQKHKNPSLVYVPFYLACYQAEQKKRYVIFSPSVVNSIGFTTKIKGALGKAKVKRLLIPRFKSLTSLLNKLPTLIERNAAFEREIYEFGSKVDVLKKSSMREQIQSGLKGLKGEGWLSDKEYEAFVGAYSKTGT